MNYRKLRVAVIGAGHLGTIHTRLVKTIDEVELIGVADPSPGARQRIAEDLEVPVFEDHRPLMGKIDAAILAAPTDHHYWIGMELAEAGVHLLVEKPLTSTVAEADALIRATRARQLVLQVGHVERFNPAFTTTAAQLHRPRYIEAVRASGYTGRSVDVGVVLDLMIHDIDLVLSLVPSEVVGIEALGAPVLGPHEDLAHARLRFANGCIANLNASRVSYEPRRQMQIYAEDAFASIDFAAATTRIVRPSQRVRRGEIDFPRLAPEEQQQIRDRFFTEILPMEAMQVERRNAILDEQHDFVISIRTGQTPQVTGRQGRQALAVAEQILAQIAMPPVTHAPSHTLSGPHWNLVTEEGLQRRAG
jgi:predicted dehydrogenase